MEVTKRDFAREVQRQLRAIKKGKQHSFNFLGYVETRDLSPVVHGLFSCFKQHGTQFYDWVDGNEQLQNNLKKIGGMDKVTQKDIIKIIFEN